MQTINIKGREYVPVVERVKEFHKLHPEGSIVTEMIMTDEKRCIVKATIELPARFVTSNKDERVITPARTFTGYSQASWVSGIMKDVALEVAETSAVGRALGFAGIGLIDGIATADEIRKAPKNGKSIQERSDDPLKDNEQD